MPLKKLEIAIVWIVFTLVLIACNSSQKTLPPPMSEIITPTLVPSATPFPSPTSTATPTATPTPIIVTTYSGLQYEDILIGTGTEALPGMTVVVHYSGWLEDGTMFDSSLDNDRPIEFPLGNGYVIPGWDEGVSGMKVGGKRKLIIPPELGYGEKGAPPVILPNSVMIFEIELLEVKENDPIQDQDALSVLSPNREFIATLGFDNQEGKSFIKIWDVNGKLLWTIPYQEQTATENWNPYQTFYGWSKNSTKLYFYYSIGHNNDNTSWNGFDLQEIQIETGKIQRTLPTIEVMDFEFSPDESQIAYVDSEAESRYLSVFDLVSETVKSVEIPTENMLIGWLIWSSSEETLIFHARNDDWSVLQVFLRDLSTSTVDLVYESDWSGLPNLEIDSWSDINTIRYIPFGDNLIIELDIEAGTLLPLGTATPKP